MVITDQENEEVYVAYNILKMRQILIISFIFLIFSCNNQNDVLITNFETAEYTKWEVIGEAFGKAPVLNFSEKQNKDSIVGGEGHYYVNSSFYGGDAATGKLISPVFIINRKYLNLLIGGGNHPRKTCVNVIVGDSIIASVTGHNEDNLREEVINLSEFKGKKGKIEIVDDFTGKWGRIYVDNIVLTNSPYFEDKELNFIIDKKYLVFPIKETGKWRRVKINIGGAYFDDADISISDTVIPDFYTFIDLNNYQGKQLKISLNKLTNDQLPSLANIKLVDEVPGFDSLYKESLRPQFHFTTKRGWLSDPNGSIYYNGIYHMYYQHNPYGWYFGYNIGWGHATSKDLIHWTEHNEVIRPAKYNDHAWSGSAAIDFNNTSGFQTGKIPPIVATYTSTKSGECIAYSNDGGMTFKQYEGNPVLTGVVANRDPSIMWYEPGKHWVMTRHLVGEYIGFYTSDDLKSWNLRSKIGVFHSFPEIFELPVEGKKGIKKWVIHDMFGLYKIGDFDGEIFKSDVKDGLQYNFGSAFLSAQTINNYPDKKRVSFAFSYNGVAPGMPFNNSMLFPVELRLKETSKGIRLCPKPIDAIFSLHDKAIIAENKSIKEINEMLEAGGNLGDLLHIKLKLKNVQGKFMLLVNGATITIDANKDTLYCKGNLKPPVKPIARTAIDVNGEVKGPVNTNGMVELEVLLDKITLEIFANDGELYMPIGLYFHPDFKAGLVGKPYIKTGTMPFMDVYKRGIKIIYDDENTKIIDFEVYTMKSIWNKN